MYIPHSFFDSSSSCSMSFTYCEGIWWYGINTRNSMDHLSRLHHPGYWLSRAAAINVSPILCLNPPVIRHWNFTTIYTMGFFFFFRKLYYNSEIRYFFFSKLVLLFIFPYIDERKIMCNFLLLGENKSKSAFLLIE